MNKDEILYLQEIFIPQIEKIGYRLLQKNKEMYKFSYKDQLFFNIFLHKDYLQGICIFNMEPKQLFSIHNLHLLEVSPIFFERLQEADECFYFDNKIQFIGILNCFYDLLEKNTENLINGGVKKLMEKIIQTKRPYLEQQNNISQKEYFLKEIERKEKWQTSIRFTEDDLLTQTE